MSHLLRIFIQHDPRGYWVAVEVNGAVVEWIPATDRTHAELIVEDIVEMGVEVGGTRVL